MAEEYVNKERLIKHIERSFGEISTPFVVREIKGFPVADVVPKSEVAREFIEIINDRIDNIRARIPYGGRAQGKTLAVEKMRLLESLKVEIAKKYTEGEG